MKSILSCLTLLCLTALPSTTALPVEGGELMLRYLFNEGVAGSHKVCSEPETELIRNTLIDHVEGTDSGLRRELRHIYCPEACCGYSYGSCGILHPKCRRYPTPSSNREECRRRLAADEVEATPTFVVLEDTWYGDEEGAAGRALQGDAQWESTCLGLKRSAMMALMDIVEGLSDECETLALSPTLMSCLFVPSSE